MYCECDNGNKRSTSNTYVPQPSRSARYPRGNENYSSARASSSSTGTRTCECDVLLAPPRRNESTYCSYDDDYDDNADTEETEAWSVYGSKQKRASRYPLNEEEEDDDDCLCNPPPPRCPAMAPLGRNRTAPPSKKMTQKATYTVRQCVPSPCENSTRGLNIRSSQTRTHSYRDYGPQDNDDSDTHPSDSSTVTCFMEESRGQSRVRIPCGYTDTRESAYKSGDIKMVRKPTKKSEPVCKREVMPPSPMKMFDEAVQTELKKRMDCHGVKFNIAKATGGEERERERERIPCGSGICPGGRTNVRIKSSLGAIEAARSLHPDYYSSGLSEAVDRLAQAEAACRFDGAVRAAEAAAAQFPEGIMAEEAAVAGVRGYQAELIDTVQEQLDGLKPIELVGYIGVTRPT